MLNLPHALDDFVEPVLHVQEQIVPAFRQGCHQACTGITDTGLGMRQGVELDELSIPNHSKILQGFLRPCSLPIIPLTVPKSTDPWVGVEVSPRFCMTRDPWQKTLTNSPRWDNPTSCRCCRSSSVVAALESQTRCSVPKLSLAPKSWECSASFPQDPLPSSPQSIPFPIHPIQLTCPSGTQTD